MTRWICCCAAISLLFVFAVPLFANASDDTYRSRERQYPNLCLCEEDSTTPAGLWLGLGFLSTELESGAVFTDSNIVSTVNLSGLTNSFAWDAFLAVDENDGAYGADLDYVFYEKNNGDSYWWAGIGPSFFSYERTVTGDRHSRYGANLGLGYHFDDFAVRLYGIYFDGDLSVQSTVSFQLPF